MEPHLAAVEGELQACACVEREAVVTFLAPLLAISIAQLHVRVPEACRAHLTRALTE